jgi:hypothetical protein
MIIEIKDLPKDVKKVTISEIVIEFSNSETVSVSESAKTAEIVKPETISERLSSNETVEVNMPKIEKPMIPIIEEPEVLAEIPSEMLDLEF